MNNNIIENPQSTFYYLIKYDNTLPTVINLQEENLLKNCKDIKLHIKIKPIFNINNQIIEEVGQIKLSGKGVVNIALNDNVLLGSNDNSMQLIQDQVCTIFDNYGFVLLNTITIDIQQNYKFELTFILKNTKK